MDGNETIMAYPGYALVGMKPRYGDFEGQIAIPGSARSRMTPARLGLVVSVNPYPEWQDSLIYEDGKLVARPAFRNNDFYISLLEKYVLCRNATLLFGELYSVRLEFIEAIGSENCEPKESEVPRCRRCRSNGEANILLGPDGYCPVCGLNVHGEHVDKQDLRRMFREDAELFEHMVLKPMEEYHRLRNGGATKDVIISYGGQRKRTSLTAAQFQNARDAIRFRRLLGGK